MHYICHMYIYYIHVQNVPCTDWIGNETDLLLLNCKRASLKAFFGTAVGPEDAFDISPIRMEELTIQLLGCLLSSVTVSAFTT